jgi:hypothetical protein
MILNLHVNLWQLFSNLDNSCDEWSVLVLMLFTTLENLILAHLAKTMWTLLSLRVSYVVNFHIYIFSSETTEPN